jgi:hypothetical protein
MVEPGQANFIAADALFSFLREYAEVALRVAQHPSRSLATFALESALTPEFGFPHRPNRSCA